MFGKRLAGFALVLTVSTAVSAAAADKSGLAGRAVTWEKEYNAGNLAAVQALYTADGCRMPPNQPVAQGSEAILAQLKAGKDRGLAKVKITVTTAGAATMWDMDGEPMKFLGPMARIWTMASG